MLSKELINDYLAKQHMMQLATCVENQPWCCTVYFVYDNELNLYWASLATRRHSQEIKLNPKVSAAIAINFVNGEKVVGVQVQGQASLLTDPSTMRKVAESYAQRFKRDAAWVEAITSGVTEHKIYKLHPELYAVFDEVNSPDNPRQELQITN